MSLLPSQPPGAYAGAWTPFLCPSDPILAPLFPQTSISRSTNLGPHGSSEPSSGPSDPPTQILDPRNLRPHSWTPLTPILGPTDPQPPSLNTLSRSLCPAHLLRALHISMVTSTDKAMVVGKRDSKTSHSVPAKSGLSSEHFRKFL